MAPESSLLHDTPSNHPISVHFLRNQGNSEAAIKEYYRVLTRFRRRFHPRGPWAPSPREFYLRAADGIRYFVQEFIPSHPNAIVLCQHGNCCQSDLYFPLADQLYPQGIGVIAVDNLGHGRTVPESGDLQHWERIYAVYDYLFQRFPAIPCHMLGESLGATMIACYYASGSLQAQRLTSGILMSSPFRMQIEMRLSVAHHLLPVAGMLLTILRLISLDRPFFNIRPDFRPTYFYEFHKLDQIDLIRRGKITARQIQSLICLIRQFYHLVLRINLPMLILQGSGDEMLDPWGSVQIARTASSPHRKVHIYPKANHSLFFDKNSQGVYQLITEWIRNSYPLSK